GAAMEAEHAFDLRSREKVADRQLREGDRLTGKASEYEIVEFHAEGLYSEAYRGRPSASDPDGEAGDSTANVVIKIPRVVHGESLCEILLRVQEVSRTLLADVESFDRPRELPWVVKVQDHGMFPYSLPGRGGGRVLVPFIVYRWEEGERLDRYMK